MGQQEGPVIAHQRRGLFVEAGKSKTSVKASALPPVVPCRYRCLNQVNNLAYSNQPPEIPGNRSTVDHAGLPRFRREWLNETNGFTLS
jgi:hypothetical protein